jgi:glycosyltransferase involved in cell wall biosynthesis
MKIKEITKFTEWMPNPQKLEEAPRFSIMMPTYRRFASGHLTRAIQSVLDQTYERFELIMIDDGSVDGSFDEIQRFMELNPRVHCLRHPRNVGLPAIGCYEAYQRSRGEYLMFCFDDTEYQKKALENVARYVSAHKPKLAFGYIDYQYKDSQGGFSHAYLGRDNISQAYLKMTNFLPNLGAIMHRNVPNEIGFLDPHLAVARITDWDYWKRAAKVYELHYSDIHIGTEFGLVTGNSLGLTYPLNPWMAYEWTERDRDSALTPGNYEEYDVQHIPDDLSDQSKLALLDLSRFYDNKFWHLPQSPVTFPTSSEVSGLHLLVLARAQDASVTLTFENIPSVQKNIRFVTPLYFDSRELINASAVVITRHLFSPEMYHWVKMAQKINVPLYFYLDDNFMLLRKEIPGLEMYSIERIRKEIASFRGVLVTSQALADFFIENNIHPRVHIFPPSIPPKTWLDNSQIPEKSKGSTRLGFMGGPHRHVMFTEVVLPAIVRLAKDHPVELVIGGNLEIPLDQHPNLDIFQFPFDISYRLALGRMQSAGIDILVHAGSITENNPYKTHNVLLNAWTLNALPILANQSPYDDVEKLGLGLLCNNTDEWYENLCRVISDTTLAKKVQDNLHHYVTKNYSGKHNLEVLKLISQECSVPGLSVIDNRYRLYIDTIKKDGQGSEDWVPDTTRSSSRFEAFIRRNRPWLLPANSPQERLAHLVFKFIKNEALPGATWNSLMARGTAELIRTLEYTLHPQFPNWTGLEFMIGTHQKKGEGQIHIEIWDKSANKILRNKILELGEVIDNQIVSVEFDEIRDSKDKEFSVRFSLSKPGLETSISIYERNNTEARLKRILRRVGILTRGNVLACNLFYSDQ